MLSSIPKTNSFLSFNAIALSGLLLAGAALSGCSEDDSPTGGTNPDALITLSSPAGGETYKVGQTVQVQWKVKDKGAAGGTITSVDLKLSVDNGVTWGFVKPGSIADVMPSWGNYAWKIPDSLLMDDDSYAKLAGKTTCRLRVMEYGTNDTKKMATTATSFSIQAPSP